jgi:myosin-5
MVVSLNPFRNLTNIAGPDKIPNYIAEEEGLAPHPFAIGQKAYKSMCNFHESQSVVISGESGTSEI